MTAIGILGGMGPQASARLHTILINDAPKHMRIESDTDFPEIVHISASVPNFIHDKTNLEITKQMLITRTQLLEGAGCVVNGIACNTAHLLFEDLQAATSVPFASLPHLVADRIKKNGHKRVGLLATPNTLSSTLYDDAMSADVELVRPNEIVATSLEAMIFRQITGLTTAQDKEDLHGMVDAFIKAEKLDVVILGCTELPLIFDDSENESIIDTIQVLAEGLLGAYVECTA